MPKIEISGRYISYECEELSEERGMEIVENGISEEELSELSFFDGGETGLIEGQVLVDGEPLTTVAFAQENAIERTNKSGWYLIKIDTGRILYHFEREIDDFDISRFNASSYEDSFNGYELNYAVPSYEDGDFEIAWQSANTSDTILINDAGEEVDFEIHDENEISE